MIRFILWHWHRKPLTEARWIEGAGIGLPDDDAGHEPLIISASARGSAARSGTQRTFSRKRHVQV